MSDQALTPRQQKLLARVEGRESEGDAANLSPKQKDVLARVNAREAQKESRSNNLYGSAMEAMQSFNRAGYGMVDLATSLPNAVLDLAGSDMRIPKINDQPSMNQQFMDDGYSRNSARFAGEAASLAVGGGGLIRKGAESLPKLVSAAESIGAGTLRQAANTTVKQDAIMGATSGVMQNAGGEVGEYVGGDDGRMIGEGLGAMITPYPGGFKGQSPTNPDNVFAKEAFDEFNVPGFQAQIDGDRASVGAMSYVQQSPIGTKKAEPKLLLQNERVNKAVEDVLDSIADSDAPSNFQEAIQEAAKSAVSRRVNERSTISGPLYKKAFVEGAKFDLSPVRKSISDTLVDLPPGGEISSSLKKIQTFLAPKDRVANSENWKQINKIQQQMAALEKGEQTLAQWIAESGGLNRDRWAKEGIDPADMNLPGGFGKPVFRKEGGLGPDDLAERMYEIGRIGSYDSNAALEMVETMVHNPKMFYNPDTEMMLDDYARRISDLEIDGLGGAGADGGDNIELNLKQLHNVKLELDSMLDKKFDSALGNSAKRKVTQIKEELLELMDASSPTYKSARETFEQNSGPVNEIKKSVVGKIAEMEPKDLKTISAKLFDSANTNMEVIKKNKAFISAENPEAWNMLIRAEVQRRISLVPFKNGDGVPNDPVGLRGKIFGNPANTAVLMASLNTEQRAVFLKLKLMLERAAKGRVENSTTAFNQEISAKLKFGVAPVIRDMIRRPIDTVTSIGEDGFFEKRVGALADVLLNDQYRPELKTILDSDSGKGLARLIYAAETNLANNSTAPTAQELQQKQQ